MFVGSCRRVPLMTNPDLRREFAVDVVRKLHAAGYEALWAGGCVRDFLLGRTPGDYDVATNARPDTVRDLFGRKRTFAVGESFGVIIVRGPRGAGEIEVATFRTEGPYLDGRRPENVTFSTAEEDAQRRDFTINGMFYDPLSQQVLDFVGGEQDLGAGIVRAIGNPHERMREDKLRMLRAVRFAATLDFTLDPTTAAAVRDMAEQIQIVSAERIAQELRKMLVDQHRRRAMELAVEVHLLPVVIPELAEAVFSDAPPTGTAAWSTTLRALQHLSEPSFPLAAATLLHTIVDGGTVYDICRRLRLSNDDTDRIVWLVVHQNRPAAATKMPPAKLKRLLVERYFADLLPLFRVLTLARNEDLQPVTFCQEYLRNTPSEEIDPPPLLSGDDLISQGFQPGPEFKVWLEIVRDAQLNGEIHTTEQALALVDDLRRNRGS